MCPQPTDKEIEPWKGSITWANILPIISSFVKTGIINASHRAVDKVMYLNVDNLNFQP